MLSGPENEISSGTRRMVGNDNLLVVLFSGDKHSICKRLLQLVYERSQECKLHPL